MRGRRPDRRMHPSWWVVPLAVLAALQSATPVWAWNGSDIVLRRDLRSFIEAFAEN